MEHFQDQPRQGTRPSGGGPRKVGTDDPSGPLPTP